MSKKSTNEQPAKIVTRSDIENKLKEINASIEEGTATSKDKMRIVIVSVVVVGLAIAYLGGRRKGSAKKTIVSFVKTR